MITAHVNVFSYVQADARTTFARATQLPRKNGSKKFKLACNKNTDNTPIEPKET